MGNSQSPVLIFNAHKVDPFWDFGLSMSITLQPNSTFLGGSIMGQVTTAAQSAVQTLTSTATGGTFTLTYNGYTTMALNWNATSAQVQAALTALPLINPGQVVCTGGPLNSTGVVCTFSGQLANMPVNALTFTSSLSGGTLTIAQTTTGVAQYRFKSYASGNTDGSQYPKCILAYDCTTDSFGNITPSGIVGQFQPEQRTETTTIAWYKGEFLCSQLIGLDANALSLLGRLVQANAVSDANAIISLN